MKAKILGICRNKAALLVIVLVIGFMGMGASMIMTRGASSSNVLFQVNNDTFMDFFNSICDVQQENPYRDRGVIYPALSYVFYTAVKHCLPVKLMKTDSVTIAQSQNGKMLLLYFTLAGTLILLCGLISLGKSYTLPIALLVSAPFLYLAERGNMLLITVACVAIFLAFYRDERWFVREIAYVSLAVAAATKIYPALFGLLLLREKDWKGTVHCVIWGALLFFVPFFKWGGFEDIGIMLNNILHNDVHTGSKMGFGEKLNFSNTFRMLDAYTGWSGFGVLAKHSSIICIVLLAPAMLVCKERWKTVLAIAVFSVAFPDFSYMYSSVLLLPAAVMFARAKLQKSDYVYLFLFAVLLVPWVFDLSSVLPRLAALDASQYYHLSVDSLFGSFALLGLAVCLEIDAVVRIVRRIRGRRAAG